jgi:hypothetical protein
MRRVALFLIVALASCKSAKVDEPKAAPPVSSAVPTPPPTGEIRSSTDPRFATLGILERLAVEKANRPQVAPNADDVLAKLPVGVGDEKQIAGWPIGARYCEKAQTKSDVHVVVCEFTDEASATKGIENASSTNRFIKRRELLRRRATSLSVMQAATTPNAESDARRIKDAFRAM